MGIYEFDPNDARRFASEIHVRTREYRGELFFQECPYCHGRGKQNEKTFSINLKTGVFHCFRASCGVSGNMVTLARDFDWFSLGDDVDEYYKPQRQFTRLIQPDKPYESKDPAIQYMKGRGISEDITRRYEVTVCKDNPRILVFPFYDEHGTLRNIKYRNMDFDPKKKGSKEWGQAKCKPILFGMKQCTDKEQLIITEGQIDSMSVAMAGFENAVSVPNGAMGFTWFPYCYDWLREFKEIVVFGDYENGSMSLLEELKRRCPNRIKFVQEEYYKGCKDANDILRKYGRSAVRDAVQNAIDTPIERVIELADVEPVNPYDLPKLKTGISSLDRLLYGGLPFGSLCVLAGKRGEGKSTLGSQILANAVDQGYSTFAYSGELNNDIYQNWFDTQLAGGNHILEKSSDYGTVTRSISKKNQNLIHAWYRGKAFLYDNRIVEDNETIDLLKLVEKTIRKYAVRVILLDNLMSAMYVSERPESDRYIQQGYFVNRLAVMALKYDVLIILVVHQRKNQYGDGDVNDEIMGSGDITNQAGVVLTYSKGSKSELKNGEINEDQRKLIVSKNRLFGKVNSKGFVLNYDEKSRRIYERAEDLGRIYGWDKSDGFEPIPDNEVDPLSEIPDDEINDPVFD